MRIISQDGDVNLSFHNVHVCIDEINEGEIIASDFIPSECSDHVVMAKYSSIERAKKVMKDLNGNYRAFTVAESIIGNFIGENAKFDITGDGTNNLMTILASLSIFEFPKDEDVEMDE